MTEAERQTAWDLKIIADIQAEIAMIEKAIEGKTNQQMVCLPRGDARPMLVGAHRTTIQIKRREVEAIKNGL